MKKVIDKITKIMANTIMFLLVIILIILIYGMIQVNILHNKYINLFGYSYFQVQTGSMQKAIEIDDIIVIKLTNNVNKDDIITYQDGDNFVTHRVVEINDNYIVTKGDSNNANDEPITKDKVIGKLAFQIKDVAIWKKVFAETKIQISIGITIFLFILILVIKEKQEKKDD